MKALIFTLILVLAVAGTAPALEIVGGVEFVPAQDVFISGNHAYVAEGSFEGGRLWVIDIRNPERLQIVSSVETTPFLLFDIFCSGSYAYAMDHIIDISNPAAPEIKGRVNGFSPSGVFVSGRYAYMASTGAGGAGGGNGAGGYDVPGGFYIVDIINPITPTIIGSIVFADGGADQVYVSGTYAYLTIPFDDPGIRVVDVSNPTAPSVVGSLSIPDDAVGAVYVHGHYAYAASSAYFFVIEVTDPRAPRIVGRLGVPGGGLGCIHVAGRYAYVTAHGSLLVINIGDPASPIIADAIHTPGSARTVFVSGNYAYVADGGNGLQVVDISGFQAQSASYEPLTAKLHIPCLMAEGSYYWAGLGIAILEGQIVLQTANGGAASGNAIQAAGDGCGAMDPATMALHLPRLNIDGSSFWADLRFVPLDDRWVLGIEDFDLLPDG